MSQPEPKPGGTLVEQTVRAFQVGDRIGRVLIREFVAAGGMGELYRGWDTALGRPVAIKTLLPPPAPFTDAAPLFLMRFRDEAKAVANVKSDNVIQVYQFGETEAGRPYMVMPFLDGEDLATRIRRARNEQRPLAVHEALEIMLGACRGVHACHMAEIIHRDLKPGNIFLTKDQDRGRLLVVVLDFGVSQPRQRDSAEATFRGLVMGTPAYMAPEQAMGMDVGVRSDEYALAALLYVCLTLHTPYDYAEAGLTDVKERASALMRAIRSGNRCWSPATYTPDLPKGLEAALVRALSPDPDERYKDAYEFARAIVPFASDKVRGYYGDYLREPPLPIVMPQLSIPISADGWPRLTFASALSPSTAAAALPPSASAQGDSLDEVVRSALAQKTSPGAPISDRPTAVTPPDAELLRLAQAPLADAACGTLTHVNPRDPHSQIIATGEGREPLTEVQLPDLDLMGIAPSPPAADLAPRSLGIPILRRSGDRARPIIIRSTSTPWNAPPSPTPSAPAAGAALAADFEAPVAIEVPARARLPTVAAIFAVTLVATLAGASAFQRWRRPATTMAAPPAFLRAALAPREGGQPFSPSSTLPQPAPSPPVRSLATSSATSSSQPLPSPPPAGAPPPKPIEKTRRHVVHKPAAERYDEQGILIPEADPIHRRTAWWKRARLDENGQQIATDRHGRRWVLNAKTGRPEVEVDNQGIPLMVH